MKTNISVEDRLKLYELCKTQLSGDWLQIDQNELVVEPIADGYINKLFICGLPEGRHTIYSKVVVRYSSEGFANIKSDTHVLAMNVILSDKNICPKLISVFSDGIISQFIESRYFNWKDDHNNDHARLLASKLAQLHSCVVPIPKVCNVMFLARIDQPFFEQIRKSYLEGTVRKEMESRNYRTLLERNIIEEMFWMESVVKELNSPLVFSHNDFNKKNILVKDSKQLEILLIDFDWSAYNYRGVDFGQYFSSWGQFETDLGSGDFPTDNQMSVFIEAYIKEMCKIFGDSFAEQEINSMKRLIKEAKVFALMAFMKDIMYCIWQTDLNNNILDKGEIRYKCYHALKDKILKQYSDIQSFEVNNN